MHPADAPAAVQPQGDEKDEDEEADDAANSQDGDGEEEEEEGDEEDAEDEGEATAAALPDEVKPRRPAGGTALGSYSGGISRTC